MSYKIVEVYWVDAQTTGDSGWQDLTDAKADAMLPPPVMRTVGYLLIDEDDHIALTDSLGTVECGHVTKIPRSMIKTYHELRYMGK
jgi:hypothetical protein